MGCVVTKNPENKRQPITILLTRLQRDVSHHLVRTNASAPASVANGEDADELGALVDFISLQGLSNVEDSSLDHNQQVQSLTQLINGMGGGSPASFTLADNLSHTADQLSPRDLQYICGTDVLNMKQVLLLSNTCFSHCPIGLVRMVVPTPD